MIGAWMRGSRKRLETELGHARGQSLAIRRVARQPRRLAALRLELRRAPHRARPPHGSAACSATVWFAPCRSTGREGRGKATSSCPRTPPARCDERRRSPSPGGPSMHLPDAETSASKAIAARIDGDRPEAAHRVDDEAAAALGHRRGDFGQRIEDPGRRLAMDERDVGDRGVGVEQPRDRPSRLGARLTAVSNGRELAAQHFGQSRQALAVGAVDQHQYMAIARDEGVDRRFDRERAAALHGHAHVRGFGVDDCRQALAARAR